jgi:hypothetical protein
MGSSSAEEATDPRGGGGDEIRPVYPVDAGAPDPLAARFCDAVVVLPERRKGECCGSASPVAALVGDQCVRTLTFALGQHAVTLSPEDVDRCVAAATRATSGCDWVTLTTAGVPPECEGVVKGALPEKAQCRSSLECRDDMRCLGLSTVDLGACGRPKVARSPCNLAVDMLATFTRQDHVDRAHPECAGYCARNRCEDAAAVGGACAGDAMCGRGRCASGKCTSAPLPALGEACDGACAAGARCVQGRCAAPKAEEAFCKVDAECRGACVRTDGGSGGTCTKSCAAPRPVAAPAVTGTLTPAGPLPKRR